ncbi:BGTF surface domain-containing protein [Halosegnis rubeus]|uniref:PGF-CTERM sorting domain-containing protein n=1 Tax=Halosegnis rubeus TaxID=2212850 RepID=A0A5N5UKA9_9EURY|nr:BGTF surface domain-containing protein [Halosegnis rubeus]KAB7519242.1 PGF-CTERM sorting domain-containing protein [Halosegnis rubeus]
MTDTNTKVRSLILTALMVVSVFGGSIAFAGAAAANVGDTASFQVANTDADVTTTIYAEVTEQDDAASISSVELDFSSASSFDGQFSGSSSDYTVRVIDSGTVQASATDISLSASKSQETVSLSFSSIEADSGEVVQVIGSDFTNPGTTGSDSYDGVITLNGDPNSEDTGTLDYSGSGTGTGTSGDARQNTTPADGDSNTAGPIVFQGETVIATGYSAGETVNLRSGSPAAGESSSFVDQYTADPIGEVNVDTGELDTGDYFTTAGTDTSAEFEVAQQTLNADFASDSVTATDSGTPATADLEFTTNSQSQFDVRVTSSSLTDSELESAFVTNGGFNGNDASDAGIVISGISDDTTQAVDFQGLDAANYTFDFEVVTTTASDSASVSVVEPQAGTASFDVSAVSEERGDTVTVPISYANDADNHVFITVGSSEVNFNEIVEVEDTNEDGMISLDIDTFNAGRTGTTPASSAYDAGDDTVVTVDRKHTAFSQPLAAVDYDLSVSNSDPDADGTEKDVAVFSLNERSTTGAQSWTAPSGTTYADAADLVTKVTQRSDVSSDDHLVVQFEASGLYSYVSEKGDFGSNGVSLSLTQSDTVANAGPNEFDASDAATIVFDAENNTFFAVYNTETLNDERAVQAGQTYEATLSVDNIGTDSDGTNPYVASGEEETVSTTFDVTERTAEFDVNDNDEVQVASESGQAISGQTSVAPGTDFTIRARATGDSPFLKTQSATVQDDGTFSAEFDFSNTAENTSFTVTIPNQNFAGSSANAETTGVVGAADTSTPTPTPEPATDTPTATPTPTPEPATDTPTATPTPTPEPATDTPTEGGATETETSGSQPGFGGAVAIVALAGAALIALRRGN